MNKAAHIIIIDDDSLIRLLVSKALAALGLQTSQASSGEQGLQLFKEQGASGILLDVMMPNGMDGFATCQELRKLPQGQYIPVLMMTGLEDTDSINRAFEVGATDFITKPINIPLLGHRVRYMLKANQTTMRLLDSEERWKFALEGSGDCVWDWNPHTDDIVFSKRWQEIVGANEAAIPTKGTVWIAQAHPEDQAAIWSAWENYRVKNQSSFTVEFRVPAADMPWKWILARGKLVSQDDDGKPLRVIGTLTDISETKSLQSQLSQAQKLEAVGQLAAGVAHEINTPIQFIGDNLSAMRDNFADIIAYQQELTAITDEKCKTFVQSLTEKYDLEFILDDSPNAIQQSKDGIDRIAEIVRAMKTFSHIDTNPSTQRIDLHDALNNALIICRNTYKYLAEVETHFATDIAMIECYPNELNQVFLNLIVNAAHAIEEKQAGMGLIRITTRKLNDGIEILIQDNGAGISEANREKVFNLFFTTKEIGKGTGQGLSLSHSIIVEKHHGKLFFDSTVGEGTIFHIQLPMQQNTQGTPA